MNLTHLTELYKSIVPYNTDKSESTALQNTQKLFMIRSDKSWGIPMAMALEIHHKQGKNRFTLDFSNIYNESDLMKEISFDNPFKEKFVINQIKSMINKYINYVLQEVNEPYYNLRILILILVRNNLLGLEFDFPEEEKKLINSLREKLVIEKEKSIKSVESLMKKYDKLHKKHLLDYESLDNKKPSELNSILFDWELSDEDYETIKNIKADFNQLSKLINFYDDVGISKSVFTHRSSEVLTQMRDILQEDDFNLIMKILAS